METSAVARLAEKILRQARSRNDFISGSSIRIQVKSLEFETVEI
jgi:hypothetical protein